MRNKFIMSCLMVSSAAFAQVSPDSDAVQERQPLLSRLRSNGVSVQQQLQRAPVQVAQPANTGGYRPGVTYPQQAQQQQPQAQPQYQQPQYQQPQAAQPGNPQQQPGQMPYNAQQPGTRPAQTPATTSGSGRSTSEDKDKNKETPRSGRSTSKSSDSDSDSKKSSSAKSSGNSSSGNSSSSKSSRSTKSSDDSDDSEKKSSSSSSSSALEKIVKNVESGSAAKKAAPKEDAEQSEKKEQVEVKKTKEEIAAEKAHAMAIKAADEATTVVAGFLKQANDGYYSKASESLAPAIQKYFASEMSAVNGTQKAVLDELTANGTINMVTYINTTVRGEGAVVEAELGYGDGRTNRRSFDLVQIEDDWKIVLPVTDDAVAERQSGSQAAAPMAQTTPAPTPIPAAAPPTAEQAASRVPLVMAPVTNPGTSQTSAPIQ